MVEKVNVDSRRSSIEGKSCRFDSGDCSYESCSFLVNGFVKLCVRYRGSSSAFHQRRMVKPAGVSPFSKHSGRRMR